MPSTVSASDVTAAATSRRALQSEHHRTQEGQNGHPQLGAHACFVCFIIGPGHVRCRGPLVAQDLAERLGLAAASGRVHDALGLPRADGQHQMGHLAQHQPRPLVQVTRGGRVGGRLARLLAAHRAPHPLFAAAATLRSAEPQPRVARCQCEQRSGQSGCRAVVC